MPALVTVVPDTDLGEDASRQFTQYADGLGAQADFASFTDGLDRQRAAPAATATPATDGASAPIASLPPDMPPPDGTAQPDQVPAQSADIAPVVSSSPQVPAMGKTPSPDTSPADQTTSQSQPQPESSPASTQGSDANPQGSPEVQTATAKAIATGADPANLAWMKSVLAKDPKAYINLCEKLVENANGKDGQYASAVVAAGDYQKQGRLRTDFANMQPGDAVYYGGAQDNGGYGHAALYNGNGTVMSSASKDATPLQGYFGGQLLGFVSQDGQGQQGDSTPPPSSGPLPGRSISGRPLPAGNAARASGGDALSQFQDFVNGLGQKAGQAGDYLASHDPQSIARDVGSGLTDVALAQAPLSDEQRADAKRSFEATAGPIGDEMLAQGKANVEGLQSDNPDVRTQATLGMVQYGGVTGGEGKAAGKAAEALGNNINAAHLPAGAGDAFQAAYDANPAEFDAARRGVITNKQTLIDAQKMADATGDPVQKIIENWQPGDVQNNAMMTALRHALVDANNKAEAAQAAFNLDGNSANRLAKLSTQYAADRVQKVVSGLTAEMGRALQAQGIDITDPLILRQLADNPEVLARLKTDFNPAAIDRVADPYAREVRGVSGDVTVPHPQEQGMFPGFEEPTLGKNTVQASAKPFTGDPYARVNIGDTVQMQPDLFDAAQSAHPPNVAGTAEGPNPSISELSKLLLKLRHTPDGLEAGAIWDEFAAATAKQSPAVQAWETQNSRVFEEAYQDALASGHGDPSGAAHAALDAHLNDIVSRNVPQEAVVASTPLAPAEPRRGTVVGRSPGRLNIEGLDGSRWGAHPDDVTVVRNNIGESSTLDPNRLPGMAPGSRYAGVTPDEVAEVNARIKDAHTGPTLAERGTAVGHWLGERGGNVKDYLYSSYLSDPLTHVVNVAGNVVTTVFRPIEDVFAGRPREAAMRLYGSGAALRDAFPDAMHAFLNGVESGKEGVAGSAGSLKNPLKLVGRALGAEDVFSGVINTRAEEYAQAARAAANDSLRPAVKGWNNRMQEFLANPTTAGRKAIEDAKTYSTFQSEMVGDDTKILSGEMKGQYARKYDPERALQDFGKTGVGFVTMPFLRTAYNMTKYGLERGPLGVVGVADNLIKGDTAAARTSLGRTLAGSTLMAGLTAYAGDGKITGAAPTDPTEAGRWQREKIQPYSVKVGDKWIDYRFAGPLTTHFATAAALAEAMHQGKDIQDTAALATMGAARAMVDLPFMRTMSTIIDAIDGKQGGDASAAQKVGSIINGYTRASVPLAGFWHAVARATDQTIRDPRNPIEAAYADLPGASQFVDSKLDAFGHPQTRPADQRGIGALNPLRPATPDLNPVEAKIKELTDKGLKVSPTLVGKNETVMGQPVTLDRGEQRTYQERAGQLAYNTILTKFIDDPAFEKLPPAQQAAKINQTVDDAKAAIRDQQMPSLSARVTPEFSDYGPKYYGVNDARKEREIEAAVSKYNAWQADRKNTPKPDDETLRLGRRYSDPDTIRASYKKAQASSTKDSRALRGNVATSAARFTAP